MLYERPTFQGIACKCSVGTPLLTLCLKLTLMCSCKSYTTGMTNMRREFFVRFEMQRPTVQRFCWSKAMMPDAPVPCWTTTLDLIMLNLLGGTTA